MRYYCKNCGDRITVTRDELNDIEEGYVKPPDMCLECSLLEDCAQDYVTFSDADPGL